MGSISDSLTIKKWWKESVVYQVYPASFNDSNGDGLGDVNGVTEKLDYLKKLGVDIVWLSPIYDSPQADMGYDISNYRAIYPPYGTIADVDRLISELKARDMKLVMDLVVNHTSSQHPWFLSSRSSRDSPKRDWYIWRRGTTTPSGERRPPNNWNQILNEGSSAWTYDEATDEYYLSIYTSPQPDLNWENPEVRAEVHSIMRFWLDRGVSGFRMDVINLISKDQRFPDGEEQIPGHPYQPGWAYFANGPRLDEFLGEMRAKVLSNYDTFTVGEMPFVSDERAIVNIVSPRNPGGGFLNMIFNFEMVEIDAARGDVPGDYRLSVGPWNVADLRRVVNKWQRLMIDGGGWNSLYVENHDQPRSVSHFADDSDAWRGYSSKLLCLMEITLCGTLFVYQGEELGMRNVPRSWDVDEYKDVEAINYWAKVNEMFPNSPERLSQARDALRAKSRDNGRTPMQWDASAPNAGFCPADVQPWMRVNDDYPAINAAAEAKDPSSVLRFWTEALRTRKQLVDVLVYGDFRMVADEHATVLAYERVTPTGARCVVVLNFSGNEAEWRVPASAGECVRVLGNYESGHEAVQGGAAVKLRPWEAVLWKSTQ